MRPEPRLIDISPVVSERIGVFPGDVAYERNVSLDFKKGHHLLLSAIQTSLHVGAHADGPNHYSATGEGIGARDPWLYLGPCLVLEAEAKRGTRISQAHFAPKWREGPLPAPRVLVKTGSFPDPDRRNSDFSSFDPALIENWANRGVRLIGIDAPSIDPEDSKGLESHQVVARFDLAILEGLVLEGVTEGLYTLIALPLRLEGADASPVRAILLDDPKIFVS